MIQRSLRLLRGLVALLLGLVVSYFAAAFILGTWPVNADFQPAPAGTEIFVCSNGVHTDFVLPVKTPEIDWSVDFPATDYAVPVAGYDHVGIGWGDLDFYRSTPHWSDLRAGTVLHAMFGLGASAVHVQYRPLPGPAERCKRLMVDAARYRALAGYIEASLAPLPAASGQRTIPVPGSGYGPIDLFYLARGRFSLVKTCNVWLGEGLKAAGLPTGVWTPFDFLVLAHLK